MIYSFLQCIYCNTLCFSTWSSFKILFCFSFHVVRDFFAISILFATLNICRLSRGHTVSGTCIKFDSVCSSSKVYFKFIYILQCRASFLTHQCTANLFSPLIIPLNSPQYLPCFSWRPISTFFESLLLSLVILTHTIQLAWPFHLLNTKIQRRYSFLFCFISFLTVFFASLTVFNFYSPEFAFCIIVLVLVSLHSLLSPHNNRKQSTCKWLVDWMLSRQWSLCSSFTCPKVQTHHRKITNWTYAECLNFS